MQPISVTPLTTTIGARVAGVDLRAPLAPEAAEIIRLALAEHLVLTFEKQPIDLDQQKQFAGTFGPLEPFLAYALIGENTTTAVIDNGTWDEVDRERLPGAFAMSEEFPAWHSDSTYCPQIPAVSVLRAEVLPPVGGGTCWANLACAYEALSPPMQQFLSTLEVIHACPPAERSVLGVDTAPQHIQDLWARELPARKHPLVALHPGSDRKLLFINPVYAIRIDKLSNAESAALMRWLFAHCTRPDFVYRHLWREGDIVVWDELATIRLAPTDHLPHRRRVVRVSTGLYTPTAADADQPVVAARSVAQ